MDHTPTTIVTEIDDLTALRGLPATLHELSDQAREIVHHARTWVCATDGFVPSPVCVLRPLAPVVRRLEDAFDQLGQELVRECELLAGGLETTYAELVGADAAAVLAVGAAQRLPGEVA